MAHPSPVLVSVPDFHTVVLFDENEGVVKVCCRAEGRVPRLFILFVVKEKPEKTGDWKL